MTDISRRSLLVAGAGGAGLVLAGCSSSGGSSDSGAGQTTPAGDTPSSSAAASSASSSTPSAGSAGSAAGSGAAGGTPLASLTDIKVGEAKSVTLANGSKGIVTRTSQTTAVAFSAKCTHQGCIVKPDGSKLKCPCHQSEFDAKTGDVLQGPAPSPLPKVAVTVLAGEVIES